MSNLHHKQFLQLIEKYLEGKASVEEAEFLERYYKLLDDGPEALERIGKEKFNELQTEFKLNIDRGIQLAENPSPKIRLYQQWKYISGVAAAVAVIVFGVWFYTSLGDRRDRLNYAKDIKPGKQGATLTLANGKKIRLTDAASGQLAKEAGVTIIKTADGQVLYSLSSGGEPSPSASSAQLNVEGQRGDKTNTLSTAKGETYVVTLPDKSKVWLNALSSITYSASLNERGVRRVRLEGEAYFEVTKDKAHPFVVETKGQQVEVLGTHFNVNAYKDEPAITTTLLEGSVKVATANQNKILKPGEQSQSKSNGSMIAQPIDTELAVAWKNNQFIFENDDIRFIMRMLERWYNIDVVYRGEVPKEKFGGAVSRFDNISSVLKILEMTGDVHFNIEGRIVYVGK